ncbi:MAG: hypothetical protein M1823_004579 [Watsoniomyces obsoletus]|nr:MAG: hypothetical protein M1823_004579 [Watsoniomyces obsoletus]
MSGYRRGRGGYYGRGNQGNAQAGNASNDNHGQNMGNARAGGNQNGQGGYVVNNNNGQNMGNARAGNAFNNNGQNMGNARAGNAFNNNGQNMGNARAGNAFNNNGQNMGNARAGHVFNNNGQNMGNARAGNQNGQVGYGSINNNRQNGGYGQNNGNARAGGNPQNNISYAGRVAQNNNATQAGGNMNNVPAWGSSGNNGMALAGGRAPNNVVSAAQGTNGNTIRGYQVNRGQGSGMMTDGALVVTSRDMMAEVNEHRGRPTVKIPAIGNGIPTWNDFRAPQINQEDPRAVMEVTSRTPFPCKLEDFPIAPSNVQAGKDFKNEPLGEVAQANLTAINKWQEFSEAHQKKETTPVAQKVASNTPVTVKKEEKKVEKAALTRAMVATPSWADMIRGPVQGSVRDIVESEKSRESSPSSASTTSTEATSVQTGPGQVQPGVNKTSTSVTTDINVEKTSSPTVSGQDQPGASKTEESIAKTTSSPTVQGQAQPGVSKTEESIANKTITPVVQGQVQPGTSDKRVSSFDHSAYRKSNGKSNASQSYSKTVRGHVKPEVNNNGKSVASNNNGQVSYSQAVRGQVQPRVGGNGPSNGNNRNMKSTNVQTIQGKVQSGIRTSAGIAKAPSPAMLQKFFDNPLTKFAFDDGKKKAYLAQVAKAKQVDEQVIKAAKTQMPLPMELMMQVVQQLHPRDRQAFAISCKDASAVVRSEVIEWNVATGDFQDDDKVENGKPVTKPGRKHSTIIVRGDAKNDRSGYRGHEIRGMQSLTLAVANMNMNYYAINKLELHGLPLLNADWLRCVVPALKNLTYLGIYRSPLMNIRAIEDLTHIIGHLKNRVGPIEVDFYPAERATYGRDVKYIVAVPALLYQILPKAKKLGLNICTEGGALYRWLKRVGCGINPRRLAMLEDGKPNPEMIHWIAEMKEETAMKRLDPKCAHRRLVECERCQKDLPGCFFAKAQLNSKRPECWACKFREELDNVETNAKGGIQHQVVAAYKWLNNSPNLPALAQTAYNGLQKPLVNDKTYYQIGEEFEAERERQRLLEERRQMELHQQNQGQKLGSSEWGTQPAWGVAWTEGNLSNKHHVNYDWVAEWGGSTDEVHGQWGDDTGEMGSEMAVNPWWQSSDDSTLVVDHTAIPDDHPDFLASVGIQSSGPQLMMPSNHTFSENQHFELDSDDDYEE